MLSQTCEAKMSDQKVELTTDGGFTGRGLGGVNVTGMNAEATDGRRSCAGELTEHESAELAKRIREASPESWKEFNEAHPDQIRYLLTIGKHTASWFGEDAPIPKDVQRLFDVLWPVRERLLRQCR